MGRSLKYEIPGVDPRVALDEWAEKGWRGVFGRRADGERPSRVLEIGFGRGEFLLDLATRSPDVEFVGVEVSFKRTLKMARKVARAVLSNVRLVEGRAEEAIRAVPEPASLEAIWINFSDPWPKKRHGHRRVIQPAFVAAAAEALAPGGHLYVATDDVPYAHQMDEALSASLALRNAYAPWPFVSEVKGRRQTGYEMQWRQEGRPMHFFAYQRPGAEPDDG
ncbi:MAG: tRNA (guanosine(46)-N7)-methyltransferase TrmB [Myxococcota bacterium]